MHVYHGLKVLDGDLRKGLIPKDARVVDQDIHPAPGLHRVIDHGLGASGIGHAAAVGDGLPRPRP